MSVEKTIQNNEPKITGSIRVRAKTEGMALCLGEKCKQLKWNQKTS